MRILMRGLVVGLGLVAVVGNTRAGQLLIYSEPSGAQVFVDGAEKPSAVTPCFIETKSDKEAKVRVVKEGYEAREQNVPLLPAQLQTVHVILQSNKPAPPPPAAVTPTPVPIVGGGLTDTLVANARAELAAGNWQRAALILEAALEINSKEPRLFTELARIYLSNGQADRARRRLQEANALFPENSQIQTLLAYQSFQAGKKDEAQILLQTIEAKAGKDVETLLIVADIYKQMNLVDRALVTYRRVQQLQPDNAVVGDIAQQLRTPGSDWDKRWQVFEQARTAELTAKLDSLAKDYEQNRATIKQQTDALREAVTKETEIKSTVAQTAESFTSARKQQAELNEKVKTLEDQAKAQAEAIRQLRDKSQTFQTNLSSLSDKIGALDSQLKEQDKTVAKVAADHEKADARVAELEALLRAAKEQQAAAKKSHDDARAAFEATTAKRKATQGDYDATTTQKKNVEEQASAAQTKIAQMDADRAAALNTLKSLGQQFDQFNAKMQGLLGDLDTRRSAADKANAALDTAVAAFNSLGGQITTLSQQRQQIAAELGAIKSIFSAPPLPAGHVEVKPAQPVAAAPAPPAPAAAPEPPIPPKAAAPKEAAKDVKAAAPAAKDAKDVKPAPPKVEFDF